MIKNSKFQTLQAQSSLINISKENQINQPKNTKILKAKYDDDRFFGRNIKNTSNVSLKSIKSKSVQKSLKDNCPKKQHITSLILPQHNSNTTSFINNPQNVSEYSSVIFDYLKEVQKINQPDYESIFTLQTKVNEKTRGMLVDWIISVHDRFELLPETLYLTINILDRYTCQEYIDITQYQLAGVASLFIASKYEEIYAPEIRDFIYVTKKAISREDILMMESKILAVLKFDILRVSSYQFITRYHSLSDDIDSKAMHLAQYIMEMALFNTDLCKYDVNMMAATSMFLSWKMLKKPNDIKKTWPSIIVLYSGYKEKDMKKCLNEMVVFIRKLVLKQKNSLYEKFSSFKYSNVYDIFAGSNAKKTNE